ncbi:MAG TPA: Holliday junction branch migration protein RuvA [Smithellaceae bacterium]|jgi:Holliday junction DNA helicase RuvA|nr:Holliday junction branch migration protein RuvA [Smithellaceae bacterium]HOD30956.1 Holliday junction branch migration protein RuvA [Smithellaceae bacterium]HOF78537.1 Holliday junction branch migration protein RuvA [Smithellaceae bacterium]HOM68810.1 Holliday junction branch migration protein RuvA [Smithellaceae bacterium]HOS10046.1 Holliday junction branch migration protein RuvA [Smithellaceae bacterium]
MIAMISGKIVYKGISHVVIDAQGVGYRVFIPLTTFYVLPENGHDVTLHIHTHVKQDGINLFGFYTIQERDIFELMLTVSGIGPKMSINILSGISVSELLNAISKGDLKKLISIPGLGKKTAERLILELKEKVIKRMIIEETPEGTDRQREKDIIKEDALSALVNLGYKNNIAQDALDKVMSELTTDLAMEQILKRTLKILSD